MSKLADIANGAMKSGPFELTNGFCCRFVRQCYEAAYPNGKEHECFDSSAKETGKNFRAAGYSVDVSDDELQPGDIVVKLYGSGNFGHIGIFVGDVDGIGSALVAENSSTKIGRLRGALGYRTIGQWGRKDIIVRLPEEQTTSGSYSLYLNSWDNKIAVMPLIENQSWIQVKRLAAVLGIDVAWDEDDSKVIWGGKILAPDPKIIDDAAYLPISFMATTAGLQLVRDVPHSRCMLKR